MNSKAHLYISLVKSVIRIGSAIGALICRQSPVLAIVVLSVGIMVAELGGVLEELGDKR